MSRCTRADLLAHVALAVLALALHARFLAGQALVPWDVTATRSPWARPTPVWNPLQVDAAVHTLPSIDVARDGAAWNPYSALGEPNGTFSSPPLVGYPPSLLLRLFAPWRAHGLFSLLHVVALGAVALRYLRWRGLAPLAAMVGATAFELSTYVTVWLPSTAFVTTAPWAVGALWAAEALARRPDLRRALVLALALGGFFLCGVTGQPGVLLPLVIMTIAPAGAPAGARLRAVALAGAACALALLLSGPRLLPASLELLEGGRRSHSFEEFLANGALMPRHLLTLLLPDALGSPVRGFYLYAAPAASAYENYQELRLYFGLPTLVLALAGVSRRAGTRPLATLALLATLMASATPLAWLPYELVPGFAASAPARALWVAHLLVPVLAGVGAQRVLEGARRPLTLAIAAFALVALAAVALSTPRFAAALHPEAAALTPAELDVVGRTLATRWLQPALRPERVEGEGRVGLLLSPTTGPLALSLATVVALALAARAQGRRAGRALLLGVVALDLLHLGVTYTSAADPAALYPVTPTLERARALAGSGRALLDVGLYPNLLMPARIREAGGYRSMHPERVLRLYEGLSARGVPRHVLAPALLPPAWRDALSIGVVLTIAGRAPSVPGGLVPDARDAAIDLWANPGALPRARLHPPEAIGAREGPAAAFDAVRAPGFDPRRQVVVERPGEPRDGAPDAAPPEAVTLEVDEADRIVLRVDAPRGGLLVLADAHARGWTATAEDGAALEVLPVDVALRGVLLPPGASGRVTFEYALPGRVAGGLLLLGTLAGIALAWRAGAARS